MKKIEREKLFKYIKKNSIWAIGSASIREIERLNIYNASNVLHRTFNKGAIAMIKLPLMLNKNKFKNENSSEADIQNREKIRSL